MNHFFSIVISLQKSEKRFCEVLCASDAPLALNLQFFIIFGRNFGPTFWDIFSISGNALMNHFFSIVISLQIGEKRFCEALCASDAPLALKVQFFIIFGRSFGARVWDIFSISGNALMNHFFSIVISCKKAKNASVQGFVDPMHLCIKSSIFHNFWSNFWAHILRYFLNFRKCAYESLLQHRNIIANRRKTPLWGCAHPMHLFIKSSIFYNFWRSFGARVWDIFSISGNALLNHFFSIVISCKKAKNASVRFCGSDAPLH